MARGHFTTDIITKKIMHASYWWPTPFKGTHEFCKSCDNCQKIGGLKQKVWPSW